MIGYSVSDIHSSIIFELIQGEMTYVKDLESIGTVNYIKRNILVSVLF